MLWEVSEGDVIAVAAPELCRDVAWFSDTSLLTWSTMGVWKEGAGSDAARPVAIHAAPARQVLAVLSKRGRGPAFFFILLGTLRTLRAHVWGVAAYRL